MNTLRSITERLLLADPSGFGELHSLCDDYYRELCAINSFDPSHASNRQNLLLESGSAIGPSWAAMCISDIKRTKTFLDGISEAIEDRLSKNEGPLHILYAGTGPFAALALPFMFRYSPAQVRFSLLEVNDHSFEILQRLIDALELDEHIILLEKADAGTWESTTSGIDIFLCEVMQQALRTEPQVAICLNILPQLDKRVTLIPERISITLAIIDRGKRVKEKMEGSGTASTRVIQELLCLDKDQVQGGRTIFPVTEHDVSRNEREDVCLLTEIQVYKNNVIRLDESALTLPLICPTDEQQIKLQYLLGKDPGFQLLR